MPELNPETERELLKLVDQQIRDNPPDPRRFVLIACGIYFDVIPQGSEERDCEHCGRRTWVGPNTLMLLELEGGPRNVLCMICALAVGHIRQSLGDEIGVHRSEDVLRGE